MKIYVLSARKHFRYVAVITLLLGIALISLIIASTHQVSIGVFSQDREIPIYSVDTVEKKIAITFDCAWEAVP